MTDWKSKPNPKEQLAEIMKGGGGAGRPKKRRDDQNTTETAFEAWLAAAKIGGEVLWYGWRPMDLLLSSSKWLEVDFAARFVGEELMRIIDVKGNKGGKPFVRPDAKEKMAWAAKQFDQAFTFWYAWPVRGQWKFKQVEP